jgi:hypothetical protein
MCPKQNISQERTEMLLSVIVPCYNEEGNIDRFYEETVRALGI